MRKRKSPIAKNLVNNSIAGIFSAIEIHNKPYVSNKFVGITIKRLSIQIS